MNKPIFWIKATVIGVMLSLMGFSIIEEPAKTLGLAFCFNILCQKLN